MKLLAFALSITLFIACSKSDQTFELNESVSIPFDKTAKLNDGDKPIFKFTKLIEESRCPEGTQCFWAGRVLIELTIDDNQTLELGLGDLTTGDNTIEQSALFNDYEVKLLEVTHQNTAGYGKESQYTAKIEVSKS